MDSEWGAADQCRVTTLHELEGLWALPNKHFVTQILWAELS